MTKPSSRGSRSRRKGGVPRSLTQSQIVEAALELTRVNGLDGLTMNALATRLGVGVMTIYSYYRGRDELLDAMADRAAAELYANHRDSIDQPWDVELRVHYRALRESLRSHPSLADLIFFRGQVLAANADQLDRIAEHMHGHIASMIHGGIEPTLAMRVFLGLSFFTLASALETKTILHRPRCRIGSKQCSARRWMPARFSAMRDSAPMRNSRRYWTCSYAGLRARSTTTGRQHKQFDDVRRLPGAKSLDSLTGCVSAGLNRTSPNAMTRPRRHHGVGGMSISSNVFSVGAPWARSDWV